LTGKKMELGMSVVKSWFVGEEIGPFSMISCHTRASQFRFRSTTDDVSPEQQCSHEQCKNQMQR